jgi:alanine racemase
MRPTVAEIRTGSLTDNYKQLQDNVQSRAGDTAGLIAVVKANAYGHGLALCARALSEVGAHWLGVTSVDEALTLRTALGRRQSSSSPPSGLTPRILVMSGFFPGEEGAVLQNALAVQLWEPWHLSLLDAAARRMAAPPRSVPVHLEIDTGMSRQGVAPGPALAALLAGVGFEPDSPLFVEGVSTHFSSPESPNNGVMHTQVQQLDQALQQLLAAGIHPRYLHAGNSVNACRGLQLEALAHRAQGLGAQLLVRPGLALYGVEHAPCSLPLQPVLRWTTAITALRNVQPGTAVGYNETFLAERPTRLALLPVGYADGLNRLLSNRGSVLVRGHRAPIVGRISMDQTILDVSAIPDVALGDKAVLLGPQAAQEIPATELANLCNTIPYEILCAIGSRVPRIAV